MGQLLWDALLNLWSCVLPRGLAHPSLPTQLHLMGSGLTPATGMPAAWRRAHSATSVCFPALGQWLDDPAQRVPWLEPSSPMWLARVTLSRPAARAYRGCFADCYMPTQGVGSPGRCGLGRPWQRAAKGDQPGRSVALPWPEPCPQPALLFLPLPLASGHCKALQTLKTVATHRLFRELA